MVGDDRACVTVDKRCELKFRTLSSPQLSVRFIVANRLVPLGLRESQLSEKEFVPLLSTSR